MSLSLVKTPSEKYPCQGAEIIRYLQWARNNGEVVHISQVESGLACQCVCDECGSPLNAKKGPQLAHHFAHAISDCPGNQETLMHLMAKEVIAASKKLRVEGGRGGQEVAFDSVELEVKVGPYRVDAIGQKNGRRCLIEFAVTHRCDPEKVQYFRDNSLAVVEIILDTHREIDSMNEFSEYVLAKAPRRWISNPVLKQETNSGAVPINHERIRELQEKRERLEPEFLHQLRKAVGDRPNRTHFGDLVEADLSELGVPNKRFLCVKSDDLPNEYGNLAMVMWHHREMRKYLGRRVGFDVIYDYEPSIYYKTGILFPRVVIRAVKGVSDWALADEIGTHAWRHKKYSWI